MSYKAATADSLGSRVMVSKEGRILTAAHVVDRATEIEVIYADGTKTTGHVVWVDNMVDLAMIQAGKVPENLEPLPLAKAGDYRIGEQIIVIGAPMGVSHSISVGYLSGVRDRKAIPGSILIPRFLQTDASINMGNSGGPMFNLDGEVIGIVSHILSKSGGSNVLGFAVSVDIVHEIINSEPSNFAGFIPLLLNEPLAKALGNPHGYGLLIQQVIPGTLADKLGFKGGDLNISIGGSSLLIGGGSIISIDGHGLKDLKIVIELKSLLASYETGTKVEFIYLRDGVEKN